MDGMSMAWMRMPGQTWPGVAALFIGMWAVMMVAMMLPAVAPMLWRYRQAVGNAGGPRPDALTALAGAAYFLSWAALGVLVFPLGAALAAMRMQMPALEPVVPLATGAVMVIAGALQFTAWKSRHLACCRAAPGRDHPLPATAAAAWRYGLHLGLHCICCCANLTATLLVIGVMDLRAMVLVAAAIALERLMPGEKLVTRGIGIVMVGLGLLVGVGLH